MRLIIDGLQKMNITIIKNIFSASRGDLVRDLIERYSASRGDLVWRSHEILNIKIPC
jgi:hypothetical protein